LAGVIGICEETLTQAMMAGAAFAVAREIAGRVVVAALKAIAGCRLAVGKAEGTGEEDGSGEQRSHEKPRDLTRRLCSIFHAL
jgi:hypothetical protein